MLSNINSEEIIFLPFLPKSPWILYRKRYKAYLPNKVQLGKG
jgi:hypothetical protein